ncbi:MAG: hypothetical protein AAGE84_23440 [Cyanobacteria bacterium P01_G01_bin.39]
MLNLLNQLLKIECFYLILLAYSVVICTAVEAIETSTRKELSLGEIILYDQVEQERQQQQKHYQERQTQLQEERQRRQEQYRERVNQQRQEWRQRQSEMRQRQLRRF